MAKEKEQEKLISQCKYFDGMAAPADTLGQNEQMLWWYERKWVFETLNGHSFAQHVTLYKALGLADFAAKDGVPIELKALLFERYSAGCYSMQQAVEPFKQFYTQHYK